MRVSFLALGAGLILASMPVASDAQRADNDILPRSVALQHQGAEAQAKGDLTAAVDFYESALAADPRNRSAIVALAQVARAQGLPLFAAAILGGIGNIPGALPLVLTPRKTASP